MKSPCWNFLFCCFLLSNLQTTRTKSVFQGQVQAAIFLRSKRANAMLIEEILQGDLERECMEEVCSREEAREYFEDDVKTEAFWTKYVDGDQCESNPCQHGGTCTDKVGGYSCNCTANYMGPSCETDVSECPEDGPYACEHFCVPNIMSLYLAPTSTYECHCAQGYKLHTDKRSCIPQAKHPCGKLSVSTSPRTQKDSPSDNEICPNGHCPWQVSLLNRRGEPMCNGVILGSHAVLTTATCMTTNITHIHIGKNSPGRPKGIRIPLEAVPKTHKRFKPGQPDYDLCFLQMKSSLPLGGTVMPLCLPEKDFSENILMEDDKEGVISSGHVRPTYMSLDDCRENLNVSFRLNNKMFCMKPHNLGTEDTEKEKHPSTGERELTASESSQTSQDNPARPRTQQTVWDNEYEMFEYSEDILPLPEEVVLHPVVTPTKQSQRIENLTNEIIQRPKSRPNPEATPKPPAPKPPATKAPAPMPPVAKPPAPKPPVPKPPATKAPAPKPPAPKPEQSTPPVIKVRDDCEFLSGTPVASVKGKTAFVTGLMLSHDCSEGLVFTKLSRYMPWLESMLETP